MQSIPVSGFAAKSEKALRRRRILCLSTLYRYYHTHLLSDLRSCSPFSYYFPHNNRELVSMLKHVLIIPKTLFLTVLPKCITSSLVLSLLMFKTIIFKIHTHKYILPQSQLAILIVIWVRRDYAL